jgi:hypothetical protein
LTLQVIKPIGKQSRSDGNQELGVDLDYLDSQMIGGSKFVGKAVIG